MKGFQVVEWVKDLNIKATTRGHNLSYYRKRSNSMNSYKAAIHSFKADKFTKTDT